jgi:hypothetical protein
MDNILLGSSNSKINTVTRLWAGQLENKSSIASRQKHLSPSHHIQPSIQEAPSSRIKWTGKWLTTLAYIMINLRMHGAIPPFYQKLVL